MSIMWVIMMKIDTNVDKCEGKVVPQVQAMHVKKFDFKRQKSDPSLKNGFSVKCQITKNKRRPIIFLDKSFLMVLIVHQTKLRFGRNSRRKFWGFSYERVFSLQFNSFSKSSVVNLERRRRP